MSWGAIPPEHRPARRECLVVHTRLEVWYVHPGRKLAGARRVAMRPYLDIALEVGAPLVIQWHHGPHGERRWTHCGPVLRIVERPGQDPFKDP